MVDENENIERGEGEDISNATNIDVSRIVDGESEVAESVDEVAEDSFWSSLDDAGISKKVFIYVAVFLLTIVAFLIFFVMNLGSWFNVDSDSDVKVVEKSDGKVEQVVSSVDGANFSTDSDGVIASYIFGVEFARFEALPISSFADSGGVMASFAFGEMSDFIDDDLFKYLGLLGRMENFYFTDVYELVNKSDDRLRALDVHIEGFADLIAEAEAALEELSNRLADLRFRFEMVSNEKSRYEALFFESLDELRGLSASNDLNEFLLYSRQAVELRAYFRVFSNIEEQIVDVLSFLRPRLRDITLNKEAILKGVHVFDVPYSDIEAIIRVDGI